MLNADIRTVVVAGAGTMGVTLARLFAQSGCAVTLWNRRQVSLDKARERIANDLAVLRDQGRLTETMDAITGRIQYTTDFAVYETADFVVENIAEDLTVKQDFFRTICKLVPETTVLATNTSGLRVTDIAQAVEKPARFCGMHWWNPPDLIPLVEVTKGDQTSQEAAQIVYDLALSLEKKPVIVKKDILGIIGNRLQYAVLREALHIIELGAAGPEEVDAAMKYGPGFRYSILGPLETVDLGGLDIFRAVSNYLFQDLGAEQRSPVLNELADQGRLGIKTGAGFYDYAPGEGEEKIRWRNDLFQKQWDLLKDQ
ncbi:3-hydroxyacyl-CoA dehydrogenase family protein [Evtepia sp.]|uniref:3-hydroxyacyl-CoA dehydrogenase family protein n=1 Tax=Evtepia sp. TaxID=2773933 RepID=UPI003F180702